MYTMGENLTDVLEILLLLPTLGLPETEGQRFHHDTPSAEDGHNFACLAGLW